MALKETVNSMRVLLRELCEDLEKAAEGNKAASQRVRTATIRLEKTSKMFRKESVAAEKKGASKSKAKPAAKPAAKAAAKPAAKKPVVKKAAAKPAKKKR